MIFPFIVIDIYYLNRPPIKNVYHADELNLYPHFFNPPDGFTPLGERIQEVLNENDKPQELKRVKCRNYSAEQKDEFLTDCGADGQKYVTMAGW